MYYTVYVFNMTRTSPGTLVEDGESVCMDFSVSSMNLYYLTDNFLMYYLKKKTFLENDHGFAAMPAAL